MRYWTRFDSKTGDPTEIFVEDDDGGVHAYFDPKGEWDVDAKIVNDNPDEFNGKFDELTGASTFNPYWEPSAELDDKARAKIDSIVVGWGETPDDSGSVDESTSTTEVPNGQAGGNPSAASPDSGNQA